MAQRSGPSKPLPGRRYSSWEGKDAILPELFVGGKVQEEFWFYRDKDKKDTVVIVGNDGQPVYLINPGEVSLSGARRVGGISENLYVFQFGAYGTTWLAVWARGMEDGLEEAAGWLEEFAPGHLTDLSEEYKEALQEAREELGEDADEQELEEKAREIAESDMTYTESGYLTSHEWWGGDASEGLYNAGEYASKALAAADNNFDMIPYGSAEGRVELEEADILKMYADAELGLTSGDVQKIWELEEEQTIDLKGFKLERVG